MKKTKTIFFFTAFYIFLWGIAAGNLSFKKQASFRELKRETVVQWNYDTPTTYEYGKDIVNTEDCIAKVDTDYHYTISAEPAQIDTSAVGTTPVKYFVTSIDHYGQKYTTEYMRYYTVQDTKAPEITVSDNIISLVKGASFKKEDLLKGATDPVDGNLEASFDSNVDTANTGMYHVIISATDKNGNKTEKICIVSVSDSQRYADVLKSNLQNTYNENSSKSVTDIENACKSTWDSTITQVKNEIAAEEAAAQAAAAASRSTSTVKYSSKASAQAAAASKGGTAKQSSDGTWYVQYTTNYHTGSAASNGSITQWEDGYYIAHDWSSNGQKIASKPGTVVVNGKTYHYVSSKVVPVGTTWSQVEAYVHANGGIGFQTCTSGGYLITHYEP